MIPWIPDGKVWQPCGRCDGWGDEWIERKGPPAFGAFVTCSMCHGSGGWIATRPTNIPGFGAWSIEQMDE